jgi:hypothetical protein
MACDLVLKVSDSDAQHPESQGVWTLYIFRYRKKVVILITVIFVCLEFFQTNRNNKSKRIASHLRENLYLQV